MESPEVAAVKAAVRCWVSRGLSRSAGATVTRVYREVLELPELEYPGPKVPEAQALSFVLSNWPATCFVLEKPLVVRFFENLLEADRGGVAHSSTQMKHRF